MSKRARRSELALLSPVMRALTVEFLARLAEAGIYVKILETWRSEDRQKELLERGVSWTQNSKHCRTKDGVPAADAVDLIPWDYWSMYEGNKLMWDSEASIWQKIGAIGESVGLRWGGQWQQRDMGHWELSE